MTILSSDYVYMLLAQCVCVGGGNVTKELVFLILFMKFEWLEVGCWYCETLDIFKSWLGEKHFAFSSPEIILYILHTFFSFSHFWNDKYCVWLSPAQRSLLFDLIWTKIFLSFLQERYFSYNTSIMFNLTGSSSIF